MRHAGPRAAATEPRPAGGARRQRGGGTEAKPTALWTGAPLNRRPLDREGLTAQSRSEGQVAPPVGRAGLPAQDLDCGLRRVAQYPV